MRHSGIATIPNSYQRLNLTVFTIHKNSRVFPDVQVVNRHRHARFSQEWRSYCPSCPAEASGERLVCGRTTILLDG